MFTRCPNCNAAFSITGQQLVIAAGMVRCGICEHVFDARPHLFQEPSAPPEINQAVEKPINEAEDTPAEQEKTTDEQPPESKLSHDDLDLIKEPVEEVVAEEIVLEQPHNAEDKNSEAIPNIIAEEVSSLEDQPKSSKSQLIGVIFIWLLLALLVLQVAAVYKPAIFPAGLKQALCSWLTCVERLARAPEHIEILNRSVHTHPHEDNALLATLTIINRAEFAQAYPIIQLRFLDIAGNVIAARLFDANHYLGGQWREDIKLPPNTPISIKFEVQDTGQQVVSYDFEFL